MRVMTRFSKNHSSLIEYDLKAIKGFNGIVGVDEAGRGALAGPLVAAAVRLTTDFYEQKSIVQECLEMNDSKQLSSIQREIFYARIKSWRKDGLLQLAWEAASVTEIESYNILGATRFAMERAVDTLNKKVAAEFQIPLSTEDTLGLLPNKKPLQNTMRVLIDGNPIKNFLYKHEGIVKGDAKSLAIAMASIIAKVKRDRIMCNLDKDYPEYYFSENKGYGTTLHRECIAMYGLSPVHRPSFVQKILAKTRRHPSLQMELLFM
jgi:ribonuclease HII